MCRVDELQSVFSTSAADSQTGAFWDAENTFQLKNKPSVDALDRCSASTPFVALVANLWLGPRH